MYLAMDAEEIEGEAPPAPDAPAVLVDAVDPGPAPAPDSGPIGDPEMENA
jgi:hypothetical protein